MLEKKYIIIVLTKEDAHKLFIDFKNDKPLFEDEAKIEKEDL